MELTFPWFQLARVLCNGNGAFNTSQSLPTIKNNAGSGVTGDILLTNSSASVGFIILKLKKTDGYNNLD